MKMNKFFKCTICVLFVFVTVLYATVPAFAVDIGFMDEHGAEGEELWEAYKKALEPLKTDTYPNAIARVDTMTERYYANYYEIMTGRTQDEFISLSTYDKVLLASVFIEPYRQLDMGYTYNSDMEWSVATSAFNMMFEVCCRDDYDNMKLAYSNLMYWQYQYYQSSGAFYNFVEGMDTLDYINEKYIDDMHKETEDSVSSTVVSSSPKSDTSSVSSDNERGIWGGFKDKVKSHILTIVLLLAFLIVGAVIAIRKKKVNAQNDDLQ